MSIVHMALLGAFLVAVVSGCKQNSEMARRDPAPAAAPTQAATNVTKQATVSPVQTAIKPLGAQPAQPPEGMVYIPAGSFDAQD